MLLMVLAAQLVVTAEQKLGVSSDWCTAEDAVAMLGGGQDSNVEGRGSNSTTH